MWATGRRENGREAEAVLWCGWVARWGPAWEHPALGEGVKTTGPTNDWRLAALFVVTAVVYLPCVGNAYVWDDIPLIVDNALFEAPFDPSTAFFSDLWAGAAIGEEALSGYFRPLMMASLWLDRAWSGAAWVAHLHSVCWHLLGVWAAARLGRRVAGAQAGFVGALWFAVHPLQSEAVFWVAARNDLIATALGLLALHHVCAERPRPVWALLATAGAMGSKESVILLPFVAAALLWWSPRVAVGSLSVLARRVAPMWAGIAVLVVIRLWVGIGSPRGPSLTGWMVLASSLPDLVGWVGWKLVVPWPLSTGHALEYLDRSSGAPRVVGWLVLVLSVGWALLRGSRTARLGLIWVVLFGVPVIWVLAGTGWMGERYLYMAILGIGWMAGAWTERWGRSGLRMWCAVGILWAALVAVRAGDWKSDETLWASAWAASPTPFTAESLGHARGSVHGPEAALGHFVTALDDPKPLATACVSLMRTAVRARRMARAAQLGAWAATRGCGGGTFDGFRAVSLASTGRWDLLEDLLEHSPKAPDNRLEMARAALALHNRDNEAYRAVEERWTGASPLRPQAESLVENAKKHEPFVLSPGPDG